MASLSPSEPRIRPDVGDILVVIHDFQARGSDELTLTKGDRVELIERDDEFGDGWFLGKHMINGNSGLFPEVYTRPAPKGLSSSASALPLTKQPLSTVTEASPEQKPVHSPPDISSAVDIRHLASASVSSQKSIPPSTSTPTTLPLNSSKPPAISSPVSAPATAKTPPLSSNAAALSRLTSAPDSQVLHDTLNVINEHITDLSASTKGSGGLLHIPTDSGSEYSSHLEHRMSYIQGEETDEEEDGLHTRPEVGGWSADDVAEYLFTTGVEKHHCEVFRDQEITGDVLLEMDQTSLFIKAFDLGSVGRRLKTWQKIKALQDEVNGLGVATRRTSEVGSDSAGRTRSRNNTLTNSMQRLPPIDDRPGSMQGKRRSIGQISKQGLSPGSPHGSQDSPTRLIHHEKRPSAASIRDLHHSRRHSSTDFRLTGTTLNTPNTPNAPKLLHGGTFPQTETAHKKKASFDRNWTMGNASSYNGRPASSAGLDDTMLGLQSKLQESPDLDRGYFSGTEVDGRKRLSRNVLKKRDSVHAHSRNTSYTEEQRVRSATALSRQSRFGSIDDSAHVDPSASPAAQRYYGISSDAHRKTASTNTSDSIRNRPTPPEKDYPPPTVTKLDGTGSDKLASSPASPASGHRMGMSPDWLSKPSLNGFKAAGLGLRAISDAVTGHERSKLGSSVEPPAKESPLRSPSRTGSSTPSGGQSFEIDSPNAPKSPGSAAAAAAAAAAGRSNKKKGKKETSAYLRGLLKVSPKEAMLDCDYSGWMKKKSSNLMTTWKPRLFVLKGRRLAYYYSEDDEQERGLIDISFHRVLPADNERLTGLHATLTGAAREPNHAAGSSMPTLAATDADGDMTAASDAMFIFKLVPPRAGLSKAVTFTRPTVHYFAVQNVKQGRLWMAALMKATIERDDNQPISTTYQQKTISLAKARQMRHRPPALMNLDEQAEDDKKEDPKKDALALGIQFSEGDSAVSGIDRAGLLQQPAEGAGLGSFLDAGRDSAPPPST